MFLRAAKRFKDGKVHHYWSMVKNVRVGRRVFQRQALYLAMLGLLLAFQDFWRENAELARAPFEYSEAYPHIVLQAFLQRVINGGGQIIREMALGKWALDLGVVFRGGCRLKNQTYF